jgi:hypothetical protein
MNLAHLLKRSQRHETITASELAEVVQLIDSGEGGDLYSLLEILGRSGSLKYRSLMERYLHCRSDPQLSALVLTALCRWWGLVEEYRNELIAFMNGVDWDSEGYTRIQAILIAGEFLRKKQDGEMLRIIYGTFSNEKERPLIRSAAYFALCRSDGQEWRDIPPASRILDFSREVDCDLIDRVEIKLRAKSN